MSKVFIGQDGTAIFSDVEREDLPLLQHLNPGYEMRTSPPGDGFVPNFQRNRGLIQGKIQRAEELIRRCTLCGLSCQKNRYEETGPCGLGRLAFHLRPFENIGLEPPINPSINLPLMGCALRCRHCGWPERLDANDNAEAKPLESSLWEELRGFEGAHSIELVGGDPVCSVPQFLRFLSSAPPDFTLPVVWDDALYGTPEAYELLRGSIDVFLPDFKFGNNQCSRRLTGADNYWEVATTALETMMADDARIIVRVLVLGGHFHCCHKKVLEYLSQYRDRIFISVLDQYFPSFRAFEHPELNRLPTQQEIDAVTNLVEKYGLRDVNEGQGKFWE